MNRRGSDGVDDEDDDDGDDDNTTHTYAHTQAEAGVVGRGRLERNEKGREEGWRDGSPNERRRKVDKKVKKRDRIRSQRSRCGAVLQCGVQVEGVTFRT